MSNPVVEMIENWEGTPLPSELCQEVFDLIEDNCPNDKVEEAKVTASGWVIAKAWNHINNSAKEIVNGYGSTVDGSDYDDLSDDVSTLESLLEMVDDIRDIEDYEGGLKGRDLDDLKRSVKRVYDEMVKLRNKTAPPPEYCGE